MPRPVGEPSLLLAVLLRTGSLHVRWTLMLGGRLPVHSALISYGRRPVGGNMSRRSLAISVLLSSVSVFVLALRKRRDTEQE
jgi:hypothetical protein